MPSAGTPRDGEQVRRAPLPASCRSIGVRLAAIRETRRLQVEEVASKLLLSKGQVLGLEQADPSSFYGTDFFLRGLQKYMAFMDLPVSLLAESEEEDGGLRLMLAETTPAMAAAPARGVRPWRSALAALALALAAGGAYWARKGGTPAVPVKGDDSVSLPSSLLPAQPMQVPAEPPSAVRAEPASVATASGDPDATLRVTVGKATWIFVRYPDNRVVERRLEAGEEMAVGPLPVFLAVGTADSVEVRVEDRPVALGPFIRNGQVRLTRPDLARLVP